MDHPAAPSSDRQRLEDALFRKTRELADFLDHAPVAVNWVGPDGTILYANQAELALLGYGWEEYVGRPITDFHVDRDVAEDMLARLARNETLHACPARLRGRDGSVKHVLIDSNVLWDEGAFVHARCFTRDVTDLTRIEGERAALLVREQTARAAAERANRAKDEFLAILGHELRNPLGAISHAAGALDRLAKADEDTAPLRAIITRQTRHLARLVDDLLDVTRLASGKIRLQSRAVDLYEITERCVTAARETGQSRAHDVALHGKPAVVHGDPVRLQQIVVNLFDNALKYTPAGGRIELAVEPRDGVAVLRVRDTGTGISAEVLPYVFEPFVQEGQSVDRPHGGLGLGLAVSRRLVELHGGSIVATSAGLGQGAEFEVRLPLAAVDTAERPAAASVTEAVAPRRIVVVEDNEDLRAGLTALLELSGHQVQAAGHGLEGLATILASRPEIALVDVGLPGLDGYALARAVRAVPEARDVFLVALTGYGRPEDRQRAFEAGFHSHLVKPVDEQALRAVLTRSPS